MRALPRKVGTVNLTLAVLFWMGAGNVSRAQEHPLDVEIAIQQKTNAYRQLQHLSPLKVQVALREAAQRHALREAKAETVGHIVNGQKDLDLVGQLGYNGWVLGANAASAFANDPDPAKTLFDAWVNDPPHRKNILDDKFSEIGVGVMRGQSGKYYASQLFGSRLSEASQIHITVVNKTGQQLNFRLVSGDGTSESNSLANGGSGKYTVQSTKGWPAIIVDPGGLSALSTSAAVFEGQTYTFYLAGPTVPLHIVVSPYP